MTLDVVKLDLIHVGKVGATVGKHLGVKVDACPFAGTDFYGLSHFRATSDRHHADRKCGVAIDVNVELVHHCGVDFAELPSEVTQVGCGELSNIVGVTDFLLGVSCAASPFSKLEACRRIGIAID